MKFYSLHAREVVCIAKGKAHKPREFGCKVGIAATNREGLFLAAKSFEGNPYDGHTLKATAAQAEAMTGVQIERIYADRGYRGHDCDGAAKVMLSGHKRGLTPSMKCELKRRSAIEPMIGHARNEGRLGRNFLLGKAGDKINAILAAAGHNLRLVLKKLALLFARILAAVLRISAPADGIRAVSTLISAFFRYLAATTAASRLNGLGVFQGGLLEQFDALVSARGQERIKTMGDAHMPTGGLSEPSQVHLIPLRIRPST